MNLAAGLPLANVPGILVVPCVLSQLGLIIPKAVTRGKKLVVMVDMAIRRADTRQRFTALKRKLQESSSMVAIKEE